METYKNNCARRFSGFESNHLRTAVEWKALEGYGILLRFSATPLRCPFRLRDEHSILAVLFLPHLLQQSPKANERVSWIGGELGFRVAVHFRLLLVSELRSRSFRAITFSQASGSLQVSRPANKLSKLLITITARFKDVWRVWTLY